MEKYSSFIAYLKDNMIFNKPSANELKNLVNSKITGIQSSEARVLLLIEVLNLFESRDIDFYYKGGIMDFKYYAEYKLKEAKVELEESWNELYNDLCNRYIDGVNSYDFNKVMDYKRLPGGKNKIIWLTKKTEAMYFQEQMGFTLPQFNDCFVWKGKTAFVEQNRHGDPKVEFMELIKKHKR